jgi:hypothetical protein
VVILGPTFPYTQCLPSVTQINVFAILLAMGQIKGIFTGELLDPESGREVTLLPGAH